jgi:hypothetical protein
MRCTPCATVFSAARGQGSPGGSSAPGNLLLFAAALAASGVLSLLVLARAASAQTPPYQIYFVQDDGTVTPAEVNQRLEELAAQYRMPVKKVRETMEARHGLETLESDIRSEKALSMLVEDAKAR